MFYYFSKLLDFLIMPYNVLMIGLIIVFFKVKHKKEKWFIGLLFLGFYLSSNSYIVGVLSQKWAYSRQDIATMSHQYDVGIVLSGGLLNTCGPKNGHFDLEHGSDRLLTAFLLYQKGVCRRLILTGTDSDVLLRQDRGEVQLAKALLVEWGVPGDDIILETKARNTRENAVFTREILGKIGPTGNSLLITSAYHMPRAKRCFDKAGVRVDVFPADYSENPNCLSFKRKIAPDPEAFAAFQRIWREWIGMIVYLLAGYC